MNTIFDYAYIDSYQTDFFTYFTIKYTTPNVVGFLALFMFSKYHFSSEKDCRPFATLKIAACSIFGYYLMILVGLISKHHHLRTINYTALIIGQLLLCVCYAGQIISLQYIIVNLIPRRYLLCTALGFMSFYENTFMMLNMIYFEIVAPADYATNLVYVSLLLAVILAILLFLLTKSRDIVVGCKVQNFDDYIMNVSEQNLLDS